MYYVNENIRDLHRVKFHEKRNNVLRLDMNENPVGLPEFFVEEVKKQITPALLATYPEKDELIGILARHNNIAVDNITLTSGSDEAMRLIFQCFGEPEKEMLSVTPTFEMYDVYCRMFGMQHVEVEYDKEFKVSTKKLLSLINKNTSLVVLLNPNSPLGTTFSLEEIREIIIKAHKYHTLVIIDEAYHYFYETSYMQLINEYDNVIVLRTFSKLCSIAGLRIGYAMGNEQLIKYIENAQSTFNVNSVAILFAKEIISNHKLMEELRNEEKEGHKWLKQELVDRGYRVMSAAGNYILFKPKRQSSELVKALKNENVWVRDYSKGVIKEWIRVSTGSRKSMEIFLRALMKCERE